MKCGSWCHVFMLFPSPDFWLINKNKMVVWKPTCHDIFRFNLHGQTIIFCRENLTVKLWNIFSQPSFLTMTFVYMMNQRSSNKTHINMWYKIARGASNQRANFVGITLHTYDFAPLTRWLRELRKGVLYILCIVETWNFKERDFKKDLTYGVI